MLICPDCETEIADAPQCSRCGWMLEHVEGIPVYLSKDDKASELFAQYNDIYETIAGREVAQPVNDDRYVETMARKLVAFASNVAGRDICDLGSGKGFLIRHMLKQEPASIIAVDIAVNYLRTYSFPNKVRRVIANAENLPFADQFDVVFATDVLEHVLNVGNFLFCANRALKVGGELVIRVPYEENLLVYSRYWGSPYPFSHLRTYNRSLLRLTLERAGFDAVRWTFEGFQPAYPRRIFKMTKLGQWLFERLVTKPYPDYWDVTQIDSRLGAILMRPIEIAVLARKREGVPRYDAAA